MFKCKFYGFFSEATGEGSGDAGGSGGVEQSTESVSTLLGGDTSVDTGNQGEEKAVDTEAKDSEQKEGKVIPEKYEITAPEGFEGIDEALLNDFTPLAKEAGISNEQAQKLADLYSKQVMAQEQAQEQQWFKQREEWVNELKSDPEFGNGNEETFRGNVGKAQLALEQFGTPALKQYLLDTGLGDNVHVLKLMAKVGGALGEDSFISGGGGGARKRPLEELLYTATK